MAYEIDWSPGLGDPTIMGWVTVVAYFVAAWLCIRAFKKEKRGPDRPLLQSIPALVRVLRKHWPRPPAPARRAAMWLVLAAIMIALGINKQLDLQTLFTEIGKSIAHAGGWYERRRIVQAIFIAIIGGFGLIAIAGFWWLTRGELRDFRLPLLGLSFIVAFVVIRAASFHAFDQIIGVDFVGIRVNWILEIGGITILAVGAIRRIRVQG